MKWTVWYFPLGPEYYNTILTNVPTGDDQILEKHMNDIIVKKKGDTYEHYMERNTDEKITAKKRVRKRSKLRVVKLKLTHSSN